MPTSNSSFEAHTTGDEVVAAFPDRVKGKIILITGANPGGIGGTTAIALAKASPKLLIIAGRSSAKLAETSKQIKEANANVAIKTLNLDLSSQKSCKAAAQEILDASDVPQVDILINNAGVMNIQERELSPEGIEMQLATNHVGHFLFTNLIAPKIIAAAKDSAPGSTRIVNLSSRAVQYGPFRFSDWNFTKKETEMPEAEHMSSQVRDMWDVQGDAPYVPQAAYGQSKTANVLFSLQLNQLLFEKFGVLSPSVHPGAINTELARHLSLEQLTAAKEKFAKMSSGFFMKNLEQGCSTTLVAALDPSLTTQDLFFADCQVADWAPQYATDPQKAAQLWDVTEELVGQKFAY